MNNNPEIHKLEELFNRNRMLIDVLIGYCKHDLEKDESIANILSALELISEQQSKIEVIFDNLYKKELSF